MAGRKVDAMSESKVSQTATRPFYQLPKDIAARRDLHASDKLVLAAITDRIGRNGKCWPGIRRLARDTGLTEETVGTCIGRLQGAGCIRVERRGNGRANHYFLPDESAQEIRTPPKAKRPRNPGGGAQRIRTEAPKKSAHNYTDPLNKTKKRAAKNARRDVFADAFKAAFDATFPEPYTWRSGDFVQLAAWRKVHPDKTPEQFVAFARLQWARAPYTPGDSLTIRGLCAGWATLHASAKSANARNEPDAQAEANGRLLEAEREEEIAQRKLA